MKQPLRVTFVPKSPQARQFVVSLAEGRPWTTIGRAASVDVRLDDPTVGQQHCRLACGAEGARIENLDFARGTWRNGLPIDGISELADGDQIEIGDLAFTVRIASDEAAAPSPAQPVPQQQPTEPPPASAAAAAAPAPPVTPPVPTPTPPAATSAAQTLRPPDDVSASAASPEAPPPVALSSKPVADASATPAPGAALRPPAPPTSGRTQGAARSRPFARPSSPPLSTGQTRAVPPRPTVAGPSAPPATSAVPVPTVPTPPAPRPGGDSVMERLIVELSGLCPNQVARYSDAELRALLERGREQARKMQFTEEEQVVQFLQCVLLLGDELSGPTSRNTDVWYTLTSVSRPAPMRLRRAVAIAQRLADASGSAAPATPGRSAPPSAPAPAATAAAPPIQPPPVPAEPAPSGFSAAPQAPPRTPTTPSRAPQASTAPPVDSELPQIEGFQVLEHIGGGGMGDIYRAIDPSLDVEVAIKVLRSMHPSAQAQFLQEARAAAKLQHPNIVSVLRFGQQGEGVYYVMPFVKGMDAERLLKTIGEQLAHLKDGQEILLLAGVDPSAAAPELKTLAESPKPYYRLVAWWIAGVADGLERAHTTGVIHHDVKPQNMLMAADGRLMLADFGLAMRRDQRSADSPCVGTPRYLSPEMLAAWANGSGTEGTDERIDVWGLGATLYEFLAFRPIYDGPVAKVLRDIATTDPTPPRQLIWQVPEQLEAICLKALKRNPDDRYRRAAHLANDLRAFLAGVAPVADTAGEPERSRSGLLSWLKKK